MIVLALGIFCLSTNQRILCCPLSQILEMNEIGVQMLYGLGFQVGIAGSRPVCCWQGYWRD